jgi:hypothetical protein
MMPDAETKLEGTTLVVRIPMRFQRGGPCKRIVAPDRSELVPPTGSGSTAPWRSPVLVGVHLAWRYQAGKGRVTMVAGRGWAGATSRAAQCVASGPARARASELMASWCLRIGMAMKLRPNSSSSRCCGVAFNALSLPNPSKK